jgi:hypothetical protein
LLAVVLFPGDLFYPVAVETVGVFLRVGVPHGTAETLWIRLDDDGFTKCRIERHGLNYRDFLSSRATQLRDWCTRRMKGPEERGFVEYHKPVIDDLVPQAYLGAPSLDDEAFKREVRRRARGYMANHWEMASEVER